MSKHKHYHVYLQQLLPATIAASMMSSGATGVIQSVQPYLISYIPNVVLPLVQIVIGSFIAWWFARKEN